MLLSILRQRFITRRLYDSPGAYGYRNHRGSTTNSPLFRETMTKLPMKERVRYKKRMLVMKYVRDREDCDYMLWSVWDIVLKSIIMKYLCSNRPTELYPRDVLHWFSDNYCIRFLRFTRAQAKLQVLLDTPH